MPRGELAIKGKGAMMTYFLLNMPVEQQEALAALSESRKKPLRVNVVQIVDQWAKRSAQRTQKKRQAEPPSSPLASAGGGSGEGAAPVGVAAVGEASLPADGGRAHPSEADLAV